MSSAGTSPRRRIGPGIDPKPEAAADFPARRERRAGEGRVDRCREGRADHQRRRREQPEGPPARHQRRRGNARELFLVQWSSCEPGPSRGTWRTPSASPGGGGRASSEPTDRVRAAIVAIPAQEVEQVVVRDPPLSRAPGAAGRPVATDRPRVDHPDRRAVRHPEQDREIARRVFLFLHECVMIIGLFHSHN
jgi:hypothetical protein